MNINRQNSRLLDTHLPDIDSTKIATDLVAPTGEALVSHQIPTPVTEGPEAVPQTVIDQATALRHKVENIGTMAIDIGTAGKVNFEQAALITLIPISQVGPGRGLLSV